MNTKFIQTSKGILGELLDHALPADRIYTRIPEIAAPPSGVHAIFVLENEITYLSLPDVPGTMKRDLRPDTYTPHLWLEQEHMPIWTVSRAFAATGT
ncbi:hypothetical protein ACGFX4_19210 [Kitasatospora sp. NPDC048365]|uniref:hypothetical protein n=1 Tax=Kitasatospora sp. NPDC048365 TaxID=3364050 RepID=UPI003715D76F